MAKICEDCFLGIDNESKCRALENITKRKIVSSQRVYLMYQVTGRGLRVCFVAGWSYHATVYHVAGLITSAMTLKMFSSERSRQCLLCVV